MAIVIIGSADGLYSVSSGNVILENDVAELRDRLDEINSLDKEGLKRIYKERLRRERAPDSTGAGLGLIDIARRTTGKLDYSFVELDAEHEFFSLSAKVSGS